MGTIIVLVIILTGLLCLLRFLFHCYEDFLTIEAENRQLNDLLEDCFLMQSDTLDAYREMLSAACQEEGFWEAEVPEEDD